MYNFDNIPDELKRDALWAVWRYENTPGRAKPSKPPRSPSTGKMLSVNEPAEWGTFEQAVATYGSGVLWNGIGFLIEKRLGITVVDLDHKDNRPDGIRTLHERIYYNLNSYSEFSPSGAGLHIICRGNVPPLHVFDVEVYSDQRFMTATGNVLHNVPFADRQQLLEQLVNEIGHAQKRERKPLDESVPEKESDEVIIERGMTAANGAKFGALWEGRWVELGYPSQSEADFALVNMLCYYTNNVAQIRRLFFKSALGQRDKLVERPKLLDQMIQSGFDRVIPEIDTSALRAQLEAKLAEQEAALTVPAAVTPKGESLAPIPPPPGFLGDLCRWYMEAAPYPAPEIALAGGLAFAAGLAGAGYNCQGDPLNLFLLLTAPSAVGKDVLTTGTHRLVDSCRHHPSMFTGTRLNADWINEIIGPTVIASGSALTKHLTRDFVSTISIQGEFGVELEKLNSANASVGMLQLRQMYLKLAASGTLGKDIWADKAENTNIRKGIALTLLGESVPERIYESLQAIQVADGFMGRLLLIEMQQGRPDFQEHAHLAKPDNGLIEHIIRIGCKAAENARVGEPQQVQWHPEALKVFHAHRDRWRRMHIDPDAPSHAAIWGRCANKAMRVAALIAIGNNYQNPIIDVEAFEWAVNLVERGTLAIVSRFERGEIGDQDSDRLRIMRNSIRNYITDKTSKKAKYYFPTFIEKRHMPKSALLQAVAAFKPFREDKQAFDRCFKMLVESGDIVLINDRTLLADPTFTGIVFMATRGVME